MMQKAKMLSLKIHQGRTLIRKLIRKEGCTTEILMALAAIQHLRSAQQASLREIALVMVAAGKTFPKMYALTTEAVRRANASKGRKKVKTTLYREAKKLISKGMGYLRDRKLITFGKVGRYSLTQISLRQSSLGAYAIKHFDITKTLDKVDKVPQNAATTLQITYDRGLSRFGATLPSYGRAIEMLCVLALLKDSFPDEMVPIPSIEQTLSREDWPYKRLCPELLQQDDILINSIPQNVLQALDALNSIGLLEEYTTGEYAMLRSDIDIDGMTLVQFAKTRGGGTSIGTEKACIAKMPKQHESQPAKVNTVDEGVNPIHKCVLDVLQQSPSIQIHVDNDTGMIEVHLKAKAF